MPTFIITFRMIHTSGSDHLHDRRECPSTVLASVPGFLVSLIEFMTTFVATIWMMGTGRTGKLPDIYETVSTVFTIIVSHRYVAMFN